MRRNKIVSSVTRPNSCASDFITSSFYNSKSFHRFPRHLNFTIKPKTKIFKYIGQSNFLAFASFGKLLYNAFEMHFQILRYSKLLVNLMQKFIYEGNRRKVHKRTGQGP